MPSEKITILCAQGHEREGPGSPRGKEREEGPRLRCI